MIVVLLWQGLVRPLPELLEQFGFGFRILSIGMLSGLSYFFSCIMSIALFGRPYIPDLSGGLFVPRDSGDLNELWVLTSTIVFELGLASLLGFFFNRFGFFIGLVGGSLLGYQIGI